MPVETLCASYILRLNQRLSRLSYELRDLRTGCSHRFDSAAELSRYLDAAVTDRPSETRLHGADARGGSRREGDKES